MGRSAVFLDRDGTINEEREFLSDPDALVLERGAAAGLRRLQAAGFVLVVTTNQSGVARGYHTEEDVRKVHERLSEILAAQGVAIAGFYHCPHHPDGTVQEYSFECDCRKPAPGLVLRAAKELDADLGRSYLVGDYTRDLDAGRRAGVKTVLVRTGYGARSEAEVARRALADFVADDLDGAARWIVADSQASGGSRDNG